ncbi:integrase, catalytic region, zinc finger, CCHC-type containing protein [Tanacetum coccineum]
MTGDRSRLMNFVKKFIGIVRFGMNDHFLHDESSPNLLPSKASKNKSWLWHRRLNHLNFGTINDLHGKDLVRGSKAPMFLWAEAVATACYTQNRSLIHTRHDKTPYELVHNKKPDLTFFWVFGALCYPTNDSENLGKLQLRADIGIFIGYAPSRKGYRIYNKRMRQIMETIHVQFDELTEQITYVHNQFRPRSLMTNDVCSHQFRHRSSTTNDVCSHQFRPRSSTTNDVCSHQFMPRSSSTNDI